MFDKIRKERFGNVIRVDDYAIIGAMIILFVESASLSDDELSATKRNAAKRGL